MTVLFSYAEEKLRIETVSLYLSIGHSAFNSIPMFLHDSIWQCEVDLPAGEHLYKFIINDELPLCDPYNNLLDLDENENLYSLLIINDNEEACINPLQYHVTIEQYKLSTNEPSQNLGAYQNVVDEKISAIIVCRNVSGIHLLTAAWYAPNNILYGYSESPLCSERIDEQVSTMFWIEKSKAQKESVSGLWTFMLFLDGKLLLSDKFSLPLDNSFTYFG